MEIFIKFAGRHYN